eukprot:23108_1
MSNLAAMGRSNHNQGPTYVERMYLIHGYQHSRLLNGPYRVPLSQKDRDRIKSSYLHREFISSSMTITVQRFKYCHSDKLLTMPFTSPLIDESDELYALRSLQTKIDQIFQQARTDKATINIPYISPACDGWLFMFTCLILVFNGLNNLQTISFWSDNINSGSSWFILVNVAYSFAFLIYFTVKQPYDCCVWIMICCLSLLFGPVIWIMSFVRIIMTEEVNVITRNNNI